MVRTTMTAALAIFLAGVTLPGCVTAAKYIKVQEELEAAEEERDYALDNLAKAEAMLSELQGDQMALMEAQDRVSQLESEKADLASQYDEFRARHAALAAQGIETVVLADEGMFGYRAKGDVLFASGSDQLTSEGKGILDSIINELQKNNLPIRVDGHTDADPVVKSRDRWKHGNIELGAYRAIAVRAYLVSKGVEEDRISVLSFGPQRPVAIGADSESKARNRRVEIMLKADVSGAAG